MGTETEAAKTVLILHTHGEADAPALKDTGLIALVDSLARSGASVRLLPYDRDFEAMADAIATSDSVVFWR
ncbi:MAG: hypothetical protein AMJ84_08465 [Acidithiobacillales bacterium SM23_46]|jgi:hypothetical protein|nr:MAG: hypothetical protein AMS22_03875 [Thiotrichales bacterium SG8_50]KPK70042.1 MAG: hypothetical protein AMJ84_08465 [Acidithiobacillales bacterium SM23_46]